MKTKLEQLRSLMDGVGDLQLGLPGDDDYIAARRLIEWAVNVIQGCSENIVWLQRMRNQAYEAEKYTRKKCTERLNQMQLQLYRMQQAVDAHQKGLKRAQVREQRAKQELEELRKKQRKPRVSLSGEEMVVLENMCMTINGQRPTLNDEGVEIVRGLLRAADDLA